MNIPRGRWWLLLGLLTVLCLLILGVSTLQEMPALDPSRVDSRTIRLSTAERTPGRALLAPTEAPPPQAVALPDVWRRQQPKLDGVYHYRLLLPAPSWDGPSVVYIPRLGNRAQLWMEGRLLARFGDVDGGQQDYSPRPVLVRVEHDAGKTSTRAAPLELVVEIGGNPTRFSGLSEIWWGPAEPLEAVHAQRDMLLLAGGALAGGGSLLIGLFGLSLAAWRRSPVLGYFGLAGLAAGTRALLWMWREPSMPYLVWYTTLDAMFGVWACCIAWFALRAVELQLRPLEWALRGLMLMMVPSTALAALGVTTLGKETWLDLTLLVAGVITLALWRRAWMRPEVVSISLALGALTVVTLSGVDHWNIFFSTAPEAYVRPYFSHYMALLFALFMSAAIAAQVDRALRSQQAIRDELAAEVRAQREQLQAIHERERLERDAQAAKRERQRIMQDMHDGLGAHLSSLLSLVQRGPVDRAELEDDLAQALDHLRLTVDTSSFEQGTIVDVLAQIRFRLDPRMHRLGVGMTWDLHELPGPIHAEQATHLQMIVLEAVTNAVRHARSRRITIQTRQLDNAHVLSIENDAPASPAFSHPQLGTGGLPARTGKGLLHMQSRATALGAVFSWTEGPAGGARIELAWPQV